MSTARCIAFLLALAPVAVAQGSLADLFRKFEIDGDLAAFTRGAGPLMHETGETLRSDVEYLLGEVNDSSKLRGDALHDLGMLMYWHPLAYSNPEQRSIFEKVVAMFNSHLQDALGDRSSHWRVDIAASTAWAGFPLTPGAMTLMYQMLDDENEGNQQMATIALAKTTPIPEKAKTALFARIQRTPGRFSGPHVLGALMYAMYDVNGTPSAVYDNDVLAEFVKRAEDPDPEIQSVATMVLSGLRPMPAATVDVFRRLGKRTDLTEQVAANVKTAIQQIDGVTH